MTNTERQMQGKERIFKLAGEGDLDALQSLQEYLTRDPHNPKAQEISIQGWLQVKQRLAALQASIANFRPSKAHRVLSYLERLSLDPPEVKIKNALKWLEDSKIDDWTEHRVPRQTGRTTLMILDILAEIEDGMLLERNVLSSITIVGGSGDACREIWSRLRDYSEKLGLNESFRYDQFQLYASSSAMSLRYRGRISTWVDNTVYDLAHLPSIRQDKNTLRWNTPLSPEEAARVIPRRPALTVESYDLSQFSVQAAC